MIIGYARVSTIDQNLDRQISVLNEYGCEKIVKEKFTGTIKDRKGLHQLFDVIRNGDTVVVESISRLGRKTLDILNIIQQFEETGVQFISLKENMDTRTSTGKAMFQMMCVIAELERNLIAERVKEGLEASKKRGKTLGRPKLDTEKLAVALRMYDSKEYSIKEIVSATGISQGSLYRVINRRKLGEIN
ncbi:recombinase family protein [Peribacillus castrilensis]|jgi:DNA invertase Pin-like site-specific DNA recombinase|uniref:Recombinase family protein n=2 Tax=Bacillaceae TaxID=186817 RepID=A0AAX6BSS5_PRIMG|nr:MULTISPECIES: recombinase family protein [Bacillaceae]HER2162493.1 recombinase family protein [Streptococcus pyogenes]MCM3109467.1 recombinase family protein [Lederbergia lenta]MCT1390147.1 recombinase family protein [Peribacillus frigoritolerans]MEB4861234.1 recombinase family protein [Priestia megaterium]PRA79604.1 resolvase [Peribacillus simplex]